MLPVVHRELLAAARRRGTYNARLGTAGLALGTMAWFYIVSGASTPVSSLGKSLFNALAIFAFVCALFAGSWLTSDCLSSEKREGTLGLLFLTSLKGFDVLLGKLVSSSFASFYSLLSIVPLLAIAIVFGGVTLSNVAQVTLVLVNTMFFSLAAGLFTSTFSRNERKALFATLLLIFAASLGPPAIVFFCIEGLEMRLPPECYLVVCFPSPLLSGFLSSLIQPINMPGLTSWFLSSVAFVHLEAWLLLLLGSGWLPRFAHDRAGESVQKQTWLQRWRRWSHGEGEGRIRYRRRLLDLNPFFWLAAREQRKPVHVWIMLAILLALWLPAAWKYPNYFADPETCVGLAFIVHGLLKIWFTSEVCARVNEDRHSGGLELLLSTPLGVGEIAEGQARALRRQFLKPSVFVLVLDTLLLLAISSSIMTFDKTSLRLAILSGMVLLPLDLWALKWVGLWRALNELKLDRALLGTWLWVLMMPWILFAALLSIYGSIRYLLSQTFEVKSTQWIAVWTFLNLTNSITLGLRARRRFLSNFRILAAARFGTPTEPPSASPLPSPSAAPAPVPQIARLGKSLLFRPWVTAGAVVVFAMGLSLAILQWRARSELQRELTAIQRRGEPVSAESLEASNPPANGSDQAGRLLAVLPGMTRLGQFRAPTGSRGSEPLTLHGPLLKEWRDYYAKAVDANENVLQTVHEIDDFQKIQFPISWRSVLNPAFNAPLWQPWWQLSGLAELLQSEAVLRLDDADRAGAMQCMRLIIGLSQVLEKIAVTSAQYGRFYVVHQSLNVMERLLSGQTPSTTELDTLERWLNASESALLDDTLLKRSLINERVIFIESTRGSAAEIANRLGLTMGGPPLSSVAIKAPQWIGRWDELTAQGIRDRNTVIDVLNLSLQERLPRLRQIESEIMNRSVVTSPPLALFQGLWTTHPLKEQLDLIARLRAAQAAIAIERWRLPSKAAPLGALEEILSKTSVKIPADPFTGQPLRYTRETNGPGYLIYGAGEQNGHYGSRSRPFHTRSMEPAFKVER